VRALQVIAAGLWLAIALGTVSAGRDLGLGSLNDPGAGFMMFWVGVAMAGLSLAVLIGGMRGGSSEAWAWTGVSWWKVPYVAAILVAYAVVLPTVGFPLATLALLFVLFKTVDPLSWTGAAFGAAASTALSWLVFARWLGTHLPAGVLFD
jgi:putative tricarboxylic transport membrane protein